MCTVRECAQMHKWQLCQSDLHVIACTVAPCTRQRIPNWCSMARLQLCDCAQLQLWRWAHGHKSCRDHHQSGRAGENHAFPQPWRVSRTGRARRAGRRYGHAGKFDHLAQTAAGGSAASACRVHDREGLEGPYRACTRGRMRSGVHRHPTRTQHRSGRGGRGMRPRTCSLQRRDRILRGLAAHGTPRPHDRQAGDCRAELGTAGQPNRRKDHSRRCREPWLTDARPSPCIAIRSTRKPACSGSPQANSNRTARRPLNCTRFGTGFVQNCN